ncbi:MAG: tRNA 2-selenouridine(34) synthase MnmH, partial [Gammaproteobacteria bacterium]|nr:tRNA 2-selenouridine(34) synthase MnmH [Gammaproteobacteria bacterium]
MTSSITPTDDCTARSYAGLFVNDIPLMDVRAPVEFSRGAFPMAQNLPLLDDDQREAVGICYKHEGKHEAIEKGHALVCNEVREARILAWIEFAKRNPNGALYCFRGGLRSQITQLWMHEAGIDFPVVSGG